MSAMRGLILTTFFSASLVSGAFADEALVPAAPASTIQTVTPVASVPAKRQVMFRPQVAAHAKPHDASRPVTHVVKMEGREAASPAVRRAAGIGSPERVATLIGRTPCDSLLCPGYAMIGVGF